MRTTAAPRSVVWRAARRDAQCECTIMTCSHRRRDKTRQLVLSRPSFEMTSHFAVKLSGSLNDQIPATDWKTRAFSVVSTTQCITDRAGPGCNSTSETYSCKLKTGSRRDKTHRNWVQSRQRPHRRCEAIRNQRVRLERSRATSPLNPLATPLIHKFSAKLYYYGKSPLLHAIWLGARKVLSLA